MESSPLVRDLAREAVEAFQRWQAIDGDVRFAAAAAVFGTALGVSYWREHHGIAHLAEKRLPPLGPPPLYERPFRHFVEPLDVGGVRLDFFEQHLDILAMSGGYKTTLMAGLARQRLRAGRRVVVVTGGQSPALEQEIAGWGGWVIRPHHSRVTFDAFAGDRLFVAQGWAELLPTSSEIKVFQSIFELAVLAYLDSRTDYRLSCSPVCAGCLATAQMQPGPAHDGLRRFVLAWEPPEIEDLSRQRVRGMKESYGVRLLLLEQVFGPWLAGQELSVVEAVRRGIPLMFVLDASTDPDFNRFSSVLVWWGIMDAVAREGGFDVFVDELARLGLPEKLLVEQIRTFRVNDVHFIGGTHASDDLKGAMGDLVQLHVFGRLSSTATTTRAHAQAATYDLVPASSFGRHSLRKGEFVVVDHEDRVQLGRVPTYRRLPNPRGARSPRVLPTYHQSGMAHGKGAGWAVTAKTRSGAATAATHKPVVEPVIGPTLRLSPPNGEMTDAKTDPPARTPRTVGARVTWGGLEAEDPPEWLHAIIGRLRAAHREGDADQLANIWGHHERVRSHRLSTYAPNNRGRPQCKYRNQPWLPYALLLALSEERPLDEVRRKMADKTANGLTVDHRCRELDPQTSEAEEYACVEVEHLVWKTRSGNTAIQWERKRLRRVS